MRKITVSVPEGVYRHARSEAAKRGRTVSALVADFLATLGEAEDELNLRRAQEEEVLGEIESFRAGDRLGRYELHDRPLR